MKWEKLGHVFRQHSALTPTPIRLNQDTVRVYAGFRDKTGVSRIGYVDLDSYDLTQVKKVSTHPVLDVGQPGCFDDNGVILGDIIATDNTLRMYYVGFQLVAKVKFLAFTGIAESYDNGETFHRLSKAPVFDRGPEGLMIRAIHSVIHDNNVWKIWYAAGSGWQEINQKPYPKYTIWYTESPDGLKFTQPSVQCIDVANNEYRIGRPSVYKKDNGYYMFYTKGGISGNDYFPGVATSNDGIHWERQDESLGLQLSPQQFDSMHLSYPRLITVDDKTFAVYNGNHMGAEGFGLAELLVW